MVLPVSEVTSSDQIWKLLVSSVASSMFRVAALSTLISPQLFLLKEDSLTVAVESFPTVSPAPSLSLTVTLFRVTSLLL